MDRDRVRRYLAARLPTATDIEISRLERTGSGASRESWLVDAEWTDDGAHRVHPLIIRRDPTASVLGAFLAVLFLWFFFWEIGGQNIPNDWIDLEEDRRMRAKTLPVRFGAERSIRMLYGSLILAVILSAVMFRVSPAHLGLPFLIGAVFCGLLFLLAPAHRLLKKPSAGEASALFNRASYYPLAMLAVTLLNGVI